MDDYWLASRRNETAQARERARLLFLEHLRDFFFSVCVKERKEGEGFGISTMRDQG